MREFSDDQTRAILGDHPIADLSADDPTSVDSYVLFKRFLGGNTDTIKYAAFAPGAEDHVVVLKILARNRRTVAVEAFARESRIALSVSSLRVARVLATGTFEARPYFVQELTPGEPLSALLRRLSGRGLPSDQALELGVGVLEAIRDVHNAGVVHCDLKPSNVIVGNRFPMLIDFGVSRTRQDGRPITFIMGTPGYMSPEQIRGKQVDWESDIFCWGILMFEASTGHHPFRPSDGNEPSAWSASIIRGHADVSGVPLALREWIGLALSADPEMRPDAKSLISRLRQEGPTTRPLSGLSPTAHRFESRLSSVDISKNAHRYLRLVELKLGGPSLLWFLISCAALFFLAAPTALIVRAGIYGLFGS